MKVRPGIGIIAGCLCLLVAASRAEGRHRYVIGDPCPSPTSLGLGAPLRGIDWVALRHVSDYFLDANRVAPERTVARGLQWIPDGLPAHKREFCRRTLPGRISAADVDWGGMRLGFGNPPGWANTGMCWFHSRFNRAAIYLANFVPGAPKPSPALARSIARRLVQGDQVVEIPGYSSLDAFSRDFKSVIEHVWDEWSISSLDDLAARVGDSPFSDPSDLRGRMDELYRRVTVDEEIPFVRIKAENHGPLTSHALLVLRVIPRRGQPAPGFPAHLGPIIGYDMDVIDSNAPLLARTVYYRAGDRSLRDDTGAALDVREMFRDDLWAYRRAAGAYCR